MKYYEMNHKTHLNNKIISGLNGTHVKNREAFFGQGKNGPNTFYDQEYEFDYLTPEEVGEGFGYDGEVPVIADWHIWWGMHTPNEDLSTPISAKFKNCLEQFRLSPSKFYKAKVLFEDKLYPYYVWQMLMDPYKKHIDFEKTTFNNYDFDREETETPFEVKQFGSIEEVKEYKDKHWGYLWNYEKLVLKPSFREFDYHFVMLLNHVVSERLKNEIEKQELTGIEFKELPIPLYFSDEL